MNKIERALDDYIKDECELETLIYKKKVLAKLQKNINAKIKALKNKNKNT